MLRKRSSELAKSLSFPLRRRKEKKKKGFGDLPQEAVIKRGKNRLKEQTDWSFISRKTPSIQGRGRWELLSARL